MGEDNGKSPNSESCSGSLSLLNPVHSFFGLLYPNLLVEQLSPRGEKQQVLIYE